MKDSLPSITLGSVSCTATYVYTNTTVLDVCIAIVLAFIGGMLGYLGKKLMEAIYKKYFKKV